MNSYALLFPGQGSQYVGMGQSFLVSPRCARLFEEAEEALSQPLKKWMFEGPADELTTTAIAQPAILLHSMAVFLELKERIGFGVTCALGHSLGEYSALVSAGVLSFGDAIRVVKIRGQLMQEAVPRGLGAMAAVIGMDAQVISEALEEFCNDKGDYAACANFNGPLQTVIAGSKDGVLRACDKLRSLGARRIIELEVSAPFHCALMKPVQRKMSEVLSPLKFLNAKFPVISNVSARPETDGDRIRQLLLEQIASPVRFTDCIASIRKHGLQAGGFLELGPKNTLSGIVSKIDRGAATISVDRFEDIARFIDHKGTV